MGLLQVTGVLPGCNDNAAPGVHTQGLASLHIGGCGVEVVACPELDVACPLEGGAGLLSAAGVEVVVGVGGEQVVTAAGAHRA